jgi:hypothetical protein
MFPKVPFIEISEPKSYPIKGFGDPANFFYSLPESKATTTSGIFYHKIEPNGGGPTIIYDRVSGVGYYDYAPW